VRWTGARLQFLVVGLPLLISVAICVGGWAAELPDPVATVTLSPGFFTDAAFSPDGEYLAAACTDGTVKLFSTETWELVWEVSLFDGWCAVAFSPDSETVAASRRTELDVVFLATRTGREKRRLTLSADIPGHPGREFGGVMFPVFSPDGTLLACTDGIGTQCVKLVDVETGEELGTPILFDSGEGFVPAAFSPDGSQLASHGPRGELAVIDVATQEELLKKSRANCYELAYAPDGSLFTSTETQVEHWNTTDWTNTLFGTRDAKTQGGVVVQVSNDGSLVASGLTHLRLWEVESTTLLASYDIPVFGYRIGFTWMRFSPDGSLLAASAGFSASIWIWKVSDLVAQ